MNISLEELLKGKATKIKDREYFQTAAYIEPFLERVTRIPGVTESDVSVQVEFPKQITITRKEDINLDDVTYNRVWVQAKLPESYQVENHDDVIGMIYGLDVRKPITKFYRGGLNKACTNLCVFDPKYLSVQELKSSSAINYNQLDNLVEKSSEIKVFLESIRNREFIFDQSNINETLGSWVRNCLNLSYSNGLSSAKLATSTAISAYKLLFEDSKSPYYINNGNNSDYFNIYNAFTQVISHDGKDIVNSCEKILLVKDILGLNN